MDLSILPIEMWYNIFGYLDIVDAVAVSRVCKEFRRIISMCEYPNAKQNVYKSTQYFYNCGHYDIRCELDPRTWIRRMFYWRDLCWDVSHGDEWNVRANLIGLFKNKKVTFAVKLSDYSVISECKEVIFNSPEIKKLSKHFSNVPNVTLSFSDMPVNNMMMLGMDGLMGNGLFKRKKLDIYNLLQAENICIENAFDSVDFSSLEFINKNVKSIRITNCWNLKERHLAYFKDARKVDLSYSQLSSARYLDDVEDLDLAYTNIADVSNLTGVKRLNLENCWMVNNFDALVNADWLNLSNTRVRDVSIFTKVKTLILRGCKDLEGLDELKDVEVIM